MPPCKTRSANGQTGSSPRPSVSNRASDSNSRHSHPRPCVYKTTVRRSNSAFRRQDYTCTSNVTVQRIPASRTYARKQNSRNLSASTCRGSFLLCGQWSGGRDRPWRTDLPWLTIPNNRTDSVGAWEQNLFPRQSPLVAPRSWGSGTEGPGSSRVDRPPKTTFDCRTVTVTETVTVPISHFPTSKLTLRDVPRLRCDDDSAPQLHPLSTKPYRS